MKRFYDGREISERNLMDLITECSKDNWKNSDLFKETEIACEIIAYEDYEGKNEDIEYILEKLNDGATLFDLENAIANGDWYFMQTETWKTQIITEKGECEMKNIKFELTENSMKWKGTTLYQIKALQAFMTKSGVRVSEGELGGWVEREENLSQEGRAWIWNNAKVCGTAKVYGDAEIWSNATIYGNAKVFSNAKIYGDTITGGNAKVFGNATICDDASISGDARIYDNAEIWGDARIGGDAKVYGEAKVYGNADIWGNAEVSGKSKISGNAEIWGNAEISGNSRVFGNAKVAGNAKISDYAEIYDNAEIWNDAKVWGDAKVWEGAVIRDNAEVAGEAKIFGNAAIKGNSKVAGKAIIYGDAEIWGDAIISGCSKVFGDTKIGGDAFISSPDNVLSITPLGKYRVSLTFFKTKNNSIKASYNWDIYTLEKFQSIMSDWTEKEQKVAKAAIEILGGC
jgi:UDP-3-O-[3-hydroxymyristoyl] glucosamine N-acyltransferase